MSMQVRVEALKQQLERLFPGKWLAAPRQDRYLSTGLPDIDEGISRGIARRRITEWSGSLSSGKTTLLRNAVRHWCSQGLNVAYIDSESSLYAADWSGIGKVEIQGENVLEMPAVQQKVEPGKFWIIRPESESNNSSDTVVKLFSKKNLFVQEAIWSADQFIRSNAFDVVILDLGSSQISSRKGLGMGYNSLASKIYARLQRALDKSRAALIIVSDTNALSAPEAASEAVAASGNWGCHARFSFNRGLAIRSESGLKGLTLIIPTVRLTVFREGLRQEVEVTLGASVPNRLFTHSQVPDRRSSKA